MPLLVRVAVALLATGVAVRLAYSFGLGRPALADLVLRWLYTALMFGSAGLCLARGVLVRRDRVAWLAMGASGLCWAAGDAAWEFVLGDLEEVPLPSVADFLYYASYALAYVALVLLLRSRLRPFRAALWLDGLLCGLTLAAVSAALVFGPVVDANAADPRVLAFTLAYPVADGALLCLVALAFALTGWQPGRMWTFLGLGLLLTSVADSAYSVQESLGTYEEGTIVGALWPLSSLLTGVAAWLPAGQRPARDEGWRLVVLPVVSGLGALAVLLAAQLVGLPRYAVLLADAALLVGVARAALALVQNARLLQRAHDQAHTDGLTGLGNRRRLMDDLERALADGRVATLLFFDLNGFKAYNDIFGHAAGDALLGRLGAALAGAVAGRGTAYRLGGDEFCALVGGAVSSEDPLVPAATAALAEGGEGFAITAAVGLVVVPAEASTAAAALQIADERMYADKDDRASGRRQARDVLLQVLREREPELREHLAEVAGLAERVGRELGLEPERLDELVRGAELHDIGKMAVPEEILRKPGPLGPEEWAFVRQHTIVGERVLNAAPALRPVARLVRASHERWDGTGYPDGLAGEAIPIGARVVAVCDAFQAMTTDRPYRAGIPPEQALAELRRAAGTQFDPRVVDAFARVALRAAAPV